MERVLVTSVPSRVPVVKGIFIEGLGEVAPERVSPLSESEKQEIIKGQDVTRPLGKLSEGEIRAVHKVRQIIKAGQTKQNNSCFDSLFNFGPTPTTVSKSVEPGEPANECLDGIFPHL